MKKEGTVLYRLLRPLICGFVWLVFHPKCYGKENIPKNGRVIFAGTHTSIFDCILIISTIKRGLKFLAKKELLDGPFSFIFKGFGIIPVDRKNKDHSVVAISEKILNEDKAIAIFPEGTTEKEKVQLPFKKGAVKMAYDTSSPIVPFVIKGGYKPFFGKLKIKFGKPFYIKNKDLNVENENFEKLIAKMREEL